MDEKKFLENFAKILGSSAQEELKKIEEKAPSSGAFSLPSIYITFIMR
jgi:hypothetical protein